MAIREGRWDCQYCGTIGNMGRDRSCGNCGRSRPEGTKFYLADDAEVSDKRLLEQARLGPNWICQFCHTSNAANITVCGSCGASREDASPSQQVKDYALGEAPTSGDMDLDQKPQAIKPGKSSAKLPPIAIIGGAAAFLLLCIVLIAFFAIFGGKKEEASVSGFEWQRLVKVETFQTVTEEDWQLPVGGRLLSQREEIHHYDQVLEGYETSQREVSEQVQVGERTYVCGQRDLGNGFFEDIECTEPVYETQSRTETYQEPIYASMPVYQPLYSYEIDKWVEVRTEEASGRDHSPFWPRADLSSDEREGDKSEKYIVIFSDGDGESYAWETGLEEWQRYEIDQAVTLKFNTFGELSEVE